MTLILMAIALLAAVPALAQTDDTSPDVGDDAGTAVIGAVSGQIVNKTDGAETPGNLEIMLHIWDADFNEKDMIHGQADGDGRFVFDNITLQPGFLYAVMAIYQDATYVSTPMSVPTQGTPLSLNLEVPVFETTTETGAVQLDGMHIFIEAGQGGLQVSEVYSLSNLGDRTVAGAASLDDGTPATIRFSLPPEADSVTFQGRQSRFFLTADGFADTAPLLPGGGSGQVVVSYVLPYKDTLALSRPVPFPAKQINILLPTTLGLTLSGDNLVEGERRDMGNGLVVDIFTIENVETSDTVNLNLSGELAVSGGDLTAVESEPFNSQGLAIGGIILGLAVIGVGLWWYRRPLDEEEEEAFPEAFDDIVQEIALLDAAHEGQEIDDETYELQRAALREQARAALAGSGD